MINDIISIARKGKEGFINNHINPMFNPTRLTVILLIFLAILMGIVSSGVIKPIFLNLQDDEWINLTQDEPFEFFIHAVDPEEEYPLNFYATEGSQMFPSFRLINYNATTALMNFTPINRDVGDQNGEKNYTLFITVEDNGRNYQTIRVFMRVENMNDPPYFIYNSSDSIVLEGENISFSAEVFDDDLIYGDILEFNWLLNGVQSPQLQKIDINSTVSNATFFTFIELFDAGYHNITLIVNDRDNATISINWNITVINVNREPIFSGFIDNITWLEDTNRINYTSLNDYFYDLDTNGSQCDLDTGICLSYGYEVLSGDDSYISIIIDQDTSNVSYIPTPDWFGSINISFFIFDGYSRAYSNNLTLTVINVNDPPVIAPIENQTTFAYTQFNYQVNATDIENDTITFSLSPPLGVNISISQNGTISMYSTPSDLGIHLITINASDGIDSAFEYFYLEVIGNYPPSIIPFGNVSVMQHGFLSFIVEGFDNDQENLTIWEEPIFFSKQRYNETAWNFSINPIPQSSVGSHQIRMHINDTKDSRSYYDFVLTINETYMPPVITPYLFPNNQLKVNISVSLYINAEDEEEDFEYFSDNSSFFNITTINPRTADAIGFINFTPTLLGYFNSNISINDSQGFEDSFILLFNVTENHEPYFINITDIVSEKNSRYYQKITAFDYDWQDNITYYDNCSYFDIDPITGEINFTPNEVMYIPVKITASDGYVNISHIVMMNITRINEPPYFTESLQNKTEWTQFIEGVETNLTITAGDEENNSLSLSLRFINFTDLSGSTHTENIAFFDFYSIILNPDNTISGHISVAPDKYQVGSYWIEFKVSDGNSNTSELVNFTVENINNIPDINWTIECGDYNDSGRYQEDNRSYIEASCIENQTLIINTSVFDFDFDLINYSWIIEDKNNVQENKGNASYLIYDLSYESSPNQTVILTISDSEENITFSFFLDIENVNRNITFGKKYYSLSSGGNYSNMHKVNDTIQLEIANSNLYHRNGSFISEPIDFSTTSSDTPRLDIYSINITQSNQESEYDIYYYTSSSSSSTLNPESWTIVSNNMSIISENYRFLNFMIEANSTLTSDRTKSPIFSNISINYGIKDLSVHTNTEYGAWIDLSHFFYDPDTDDIITYNYTMIEGDILVNITIFQEKFVKIKFLHSGTSKFYFTASDSFNSTAISNNITVVIQDSGQSSSQSARSSGGSGAQIITQYKYKDKIELVSLDIIHPESVTIYENETIEVPVTLKNNENFDLIGAVLSAEVDREGLEISIQPERFDVIPPQKNKTTMIIMNMTKVYDSYGILISVNITEPDYQDSAKILVSSLKQSKAGDESQQMKLAFVSDILQKNSECAELSEYIVRAREYYEQGSTDEGHRLLDQFINDCKSLISETEKKEENPVDIKKILKEQIAGSEKNLIATITIALIILGSMIATIIFAYKKI